MHRFHEDIIVYPDVDSIVDFAAKYGRSDLKEPNESTTQTSKVLLDHVRWVLVNL